MAFDKSQFFDQFRAETKERLQNMVSILIEIEKHPSMEQCEILMREAHSIKGAATMLGFKRIAELAHKMEDGIQCEIDHNFQLEKEHFDLLLKSIDVVEALLEDKISWEDKGIHPRIVEDLCAQMDKLFHLQDSVTPKSAKVKEPAPREQDISEALEAEHKEEVPSSIPIEQASRVSSIRVEIAKLDELMNLSGELTICRNRLNDISRQLVLRLGTIEESAAVPWLPEVSGTLKQLDKNISFLTENLQKEIMKVRLVPVSTLFTVFRRSMRDLAGEQGKDIELIVEGENTEIDKGIIDEMRAPLMHILRNAVDHGVEDAAEREKQGKPAKAKIFLGAFSQGTQIVLEISDDGRGINVAKIREKFLMKDPSAKKKLEEMADEQIKQLIFTPGFSTSDEVSEVSGRGVGMDVVREKVSELKGSIELHSVPGQGTTFSIKLPLTLSIRENLLVGVGNEVFAIPIDAVLETIRVQTEDIKVIENKKSVDFRGHIVPLIDLNDLFQFPHKGIMERRYISVVIVQAVENKVGFLVDELMGREEIVTKSIGAPLHKVKNILGATILGDGRVVLILDVPSIIEMAEGEQPSHSLKAKPVRIKKKKTILLAEDTFSTAALEKNILEAVGYSVVLAKDGQEALEKASHETFDLIMTDVLMPRMDGFALTERLKKSPNNKQTPVIIVTTRGSDEDKRRGVDVGADAYILKSDFTSDLLLETIDRLIG